MHRRRYLESAGGVLGAALLAGCLDGVDSLAGGDQERAASADDGEDDEDDSDTNDADRQIRTAAGRLNRSGASLRESQGTLEDPEHTEYDPDEPGAFLAEGLEALEAAEAADPTDEERADIDALYEYADVLEPMIEVTAIVTSDLGGDIDAINGAVEDGALAEARSDTESLQSRFGDARADLEPAVVSIDDLEAARLEERSISSLDDVADGAEKLLSVTTSLKTLADGMASLVAGHQYLDDGREELNAQAFDDAIETFETAVGHYADTSGNMQSGGEDAPSGLLGYFDESYCQATNLEAAAATFREAAEAGGDGDYERVEDLRTDAESQVEAAHDCHR